MPHFLSRKLARRLHDGGWTPEKLNPRVTSLAAGAITATSVKGAALVVMGRPTVPLTAAEIAVLHAFVAEVHPGCTPADSAELGGACLLESSNCSGTARSPGAAADQHRPAAWQCKYTSSGGGQCGRR